MTQNHAPETDRVDLAPQKAREVHAMFSNVARNYDTLNSIISLGIHHGWRRRCVTWSGAAPGDRILDLATGTGDLALEFKRAVGPTGSVLGTDFNPEMLSSAPAKAKAAGLDVKFEIADATKLSYADHSFDVTSISFGIRNVHDPVKAVSEMARVTRNGGRVMVLETGQAVNPLFRGVFDFYFSTVMPRIAGLLGGDPEAYKYLQRSSANFPSGDAFLEIMRKGAKFSTVEAVPLFGGVSWLYRGVVEK